MYEFTIFIIFPIVNILLFRIILKHNDEMLGNWLATLMALIFCVAPYINAFVFLALFIVNILLIKENENFKNLIKKILFLKGDI